MNSNETEDNCRQQITRRRGACNLCREKKVRCNGRRPCSFCEKHQASCLYQRLPRKTTNQRTDDGNIQRSAFTSNPDLCTQWGKQLENQHLHLESTHGPGRSWEGMWPSDPGPMELQEELDTMDLVLEWSPRHVLLDTSAQDPPTSLPYDNDDLEWLTQQPTIGST
ncbi:hypothetical protein GGR57DRAFT_44710 [Xylariaceae sp. FL1272]|nr:hypothetical protein GGR57DRAFT_44710 [Xylariaceae sp. FL1272]